MAKPSRLIAKHPFLEPRFLAACTIIGLGVTFGFTLMAAKILVLIGLIASLASAFGAISIYAKHYRAVYLTIANGKKYQGPRAVELFVSFAIIVTVIVISPILYVANIGEEIQLNKAELRLVGLEPFRQPGFKDQIQLNVRWKNSGSLTATDIRISLKGALQNGPTPVIDKPLIDVKSVMSHLEGAKKLDATDTLSQDFVIFTVPDLVLSDADWTAVLQGSAAVYVFYSLSYQDDAIRGKGQHWHGDFCAWFTYGQNFYHNCGPNRLQRASGSY